MFELQCNLRQDATDRAAPGLVLGQSHITGGQEPAVNLPPCPTVVPQTRVIPGGPA